MGGGLLRIFFLEMMLGVGRDDAVFFCGVWEVWGGKREPNEK